jgi:hypothetical protein
MLKRTHYNRITSQKKHWGTFRKHFLNHVIFFDQSGKLIRNATWEASGVTFLEEESEPRNTENNFD